MSKTLIVLQTPAMKEIVEGILDDKNSYEFAIIQNVLCNCEKCVSCIESDAIKPLDLKFFKDLKNKYVVEVADSIDINADYVLFVCDNKLTTFYSMVEFCERNDISVHKILYKDSNSLSIDEAIDIPNIENVHFFFDMSIDDFVA